MKSNYLLLKKERGPVVIEKTKTIMELHVSPSFLKEKFVPVETIPRKVSIRRINELQRRYLENAYWGASKRFFDILVSSTVVLLVLSWLYPLLFILIRLESKGSIIFKQKRNGLNQTPFDCYKFRSMEINDSCNSIPTQDKDPRITKMGLFMRKYSIDELPQFFNVLKGDMTVVGPRPHMLSETNSFKKISEDFYKRHRVKPGITGLAQINNCRGKINSYDDLSSRVKYDLFYIKNASLKYDFQIVYSTFIKMIFGDPMAK